MRGLSEKSLRLIGREFRHGGRSDRGESRIKEKMSSERGEEDEWGKEEQRSGE